MEKTSSGEGSSPHGHLGARDLWKHKFLMDGWAGSTIHGFHPSVLTSDSASPLHKFWERESQESNLGIPAFSLHVSKEQEHWEGLGSSWARKNILRISGWWEKGFREAESNGSGVNPTPLEAPPSYCRAQDLLLQLQFAI